MHLHVPASIHSVPYAGVLPTRSLLVASPTVTSTEKLCKLGSKSAPSNEKSDDVNTIGPVAKPSGIDTICVMFVSMLESSINRSTRFAEAGSNIAMAEELEESLPGPRYLELKSVPRDELAMAAFGAKPNAIATSWTD